MLLSWDEKAPFCLLKICGIRSAGLRRLGERVALDFAPRQLGKLALFPKTIIV